jgi:hypothetical protein
MVEPSKLRFLSILLFFEFLSLVFVGFFLTVDINYLLFFFFWILSKFLWFKIRFA